MALGVATLHEAGGRRGLLAGVRLLVGPPFAGPALTVSLPAGDNLGIHVALASAPAGAVLCVSSAGRGLYGVVGELIQEAARARSLAALVLEDGIRDLSKLAPPPSLAALGVSPRGTIKSRLRSLGETIGLGGTLVHPGDWIVGDEDGVCVIPGERLEMVLDRARDRLAHEDALRERARRGQPLLNAGVPDAQQEVLP